MLQIVIAGTVDEKMGLFFYLLYFLPELWPLNCQEKKHFFAVLC